MMPFGRLLGRPKAWRATDAPVVARIGDDFRAVTTALIVGDSDQAAQILATCPDPELALSAAAHQLAVLYRGVCDASGRKPLELWAQLLLFLEETNQ